MKNIDIIVRAVILDKDKILLCKKKGNNYYFLPGGHVEFGETAQQALTRELKEELNIEADTIDYIGTIENFFEEANKKCHEINLVFYVDAKDASDKTPEDHIEFYWKDIKELVGENVEPVTLKQAVLQWLKDKKLFWGSEKE